MHSVHGSPPLLTVGRAGRSDVHPDHRALRVLRARHRARRAVQHVLRQ